ncbi:bifunctional demethylmenaquinone methyltransferase/2-methoxy-6-polyprenyl-1,4-benzoquinol methylase UbiE [Trichothermofontia sp.]
MSVSASISANSIAQRSQVAAASSRPQPPEPPPSDPPLAEDRTAHRVQAIFNQIAPCYDALNDWLSLGLHRVWKQMTVNWCAAQQGDICLDVCCGSGDLTLLLAKQVGRTGQVYGLDFAAGQLAIARQRHERTAPHLPIQWFQGDALALPFPEQHFDAVTLSYGLRNVLDIPRSLREVYRVLKPGAKAAILDFNHPQSPQMQTFQAWYLHAIVVPVAQYWGLGEEYAYIAPSLARFPTGAEQVQMAKAAGFSAAVHYPITGGLMGVLVATR